MTIAFDLFPINQLVLSVIMLMKVEFLTEFKAEIKQATSDFMKDLKVED